MMEVEIRICGILGSEWLLFCLVLDCEAVHLARGFHSFQHFIFLALSVYYEIGSDCIRGLACEMLAVRTHWL